MEFNKIILLTDAKIYEWKLQPNTISISMVSIFILYCIIAFFIAYIRVDFDKIKLESDIRVIQQEQYTMELYEKQLVGKYNDLVTPDIHKDFVKAAITLVNPFLDHECIKWWSDLIYAGQFSIKENLNQWTLNKINSQFSSLHIPPGAALILSVAALENSFDILGSSNKGAVGAFQLHPTLTAELELPNPSHPEQNILIGISYLNSLLNQFKDYPDQLEFALAAYNAGPSRVGGDWITQWGPSWTTINAELQNSQKTYEETRNYVIMGTYLTRIYVSGEWRKKPIEFWQNYRERILREARSIPLAAMTGSVFLQ